VTAPGILGLDSPETAWRDIGIARGGTSATLHWRDSRSRVFQPPWGQGAQGKALSAGSFTDQPGYRPRWAAHMRYRSSRQRAFMPGYGQPNQGIAFPLVTRGQAGWHPRWAPYIRRGRQFVPHMPQAVLPAPPLPLFTRQAGLHPRAWAPQASRMRARLLQPPPRWAASVYVAALYSRPRRDLRLPAYTRGYRQRHFAPRWLVQVPSSLLSGAGTLTATAIDTQGALVTVAMSGTGTLSVQMYEAYSQPPVALDYRPADHTLLLSQSYDLLSELAQCQLGRGANVPAGSTDFGFVDTTYSVTKAQILAGANSSAF
jgi:hypothetical protein